MDGSTSPPGTGTKSCSLDLGSLYKNDELFAQNFFDSMHDMELPADFDASQVDYDFPESGIFLSLRLSWMDEGIPKLGGPAEVLDIS